MYLFEDRKRNEAHFSIIGSILPAQTDPGTVTAVLMSPAAADRAWQK